jgi:hypothetical protein
LFREKAAQVVTDLAQKFIDDDCRVRECRGGYILVEKPRQTPISYNCPECNRGHLDVPSIPTYRGPLTFYSPEEMARAKDERREIVFRQRAMAEA